MHRVVLEDQDLNNEFSELVVDFLELFSSVSRLKGTNDSISLKRALVAYVMVWQLRYKKHCQWMLLIKYL